MKNAFTPFLSFLSFFLVIIEKQRERGRGKLELERETTRVFTWPRVAEELNAI